MKTAIKVGDRVRYKAEFLRSIGCYTGILPQAKGEITKFTLKVGNTFLANIKWESGSEELPMTVNTANLELIS